MKTIKHLNKKQLFSYSKGGLNAEDLRETGDHLLTCEVCLAALPEPSPDQFLKVLFTENDVNKQIEAEKSEPDKSFIRSIPLLYKQPSSIAWVSGALILVVSFSIFVWFSVSRQNQSDRELAVVSYEKQEANLDLIPNNQKNELMIDDEDPDKNQASSKSAKTLVSKKEVQKPLNEKNNRSQQDFRKVKKRRVPRRKDVNKFAATRGGNSSIDKCGETLGAKFQANGKKIVLRWKKYPDAAKYNLYISDDEEILVDEYETENKTSYILNKSLDPDKTYNWKILVTLENGETVIGTSKKFSIKDLKKMNDEIFKSEGKPDVRCAEKN